VDETRIAFSSRSRGKTFIGLAAGTLVIGVLAGLSFATAARGDRSAGWISAGVWVGVWLPLTFYVLNLALGKTVLSSAGIRFSTFVSRRFIPWDQITKIEVQKRSGRNGSWQVIRAHRSSGRPRVLPGAMSSPDSTAEIEKKARAICSRWEEVTGQPQSPVFTR